MTTIVIPHHHLIGIASDLAARRDAWPEIRSILTTVGMRGCLWCNMCSTETVSATCNNYIGAALAAEGGYLAGALCIFHRRTGSCVAMHVRPARSPLWES